MKHSTTAHRVHIIKCTSSSFWEIRDVQGFCHSVPLARRQVATYAEQAFSIRLWRWGWNQINGDLGQKWIFSLASLPELDSTAIQNCTRAHFSSIVGKFSLWTNTSRCWLGTRTGQLLLQELEPLQRHACFRRAVGQSPQCRIQGTVVSVIIVSVWDFFVFVLVFVNENHSV